MKPGIVVTNKHVVQDELLNTLSVHFPSAEPAQQGPFRPTLLYESPDRDVAFLSIESSLPPLQVAEEYVFRRGQEVIVIGSPGRGDQTVLQNAISVNVGLKAVRDELEPKLSRIDSFIVADVKRDVSQLGADVHLSDAARQRLADLWTNYQELKGYVDNPRGHFDSYKMKLLELSDKHKRASEALRLLLGVELDEDD